jgi:hypothetical protein
MIILRAIYIFINACSRPKVKAQTEGNAELRLGGNADIQGRESDRRTKKVY